MARTKGMVTARPPILSRRGHQQRITKLPNTLPDKP